MTAAALNLHDVNIYEQSILNLLSLAMDENGFCFITQPKIAEQCNMSLLACKRSISSLAEKDLLYVVRLSGFSPSYIINVAKLKIYTDSRKED
jgi:hypothetical protein